MSYLADIDQSPMFSSIRKDRHAQHEPTTSALYDIAAQLEELAHSYDEEYKENSNVISETTDSAAFVYTARRSKVEALMTEVRNCRQASTKAKMAAEDNKKLDHLAEQLYILDEKKQALLIRADKLQESIDVLAAQKQKSDEQMAQLSEKRKQIAQETAETLPTLAFMRKLFKAVSSATIHKQTNPNVIDGFISKSDSLEIVPFCCDKNDQSFNYVNNVWTIIREQ